MKHVSAVAALLFVIAVAIAFVALDSRATADAIRSELIATESTRAEYRDGDNYRAQIVGLRREWETRKARAGAATLGAAASLLMAGAFAALSRRGTGDL